MPLTPAEAAAHLLAIRAAQSSFGGFVRLMHPEWEIQPHHQEIITTLDLLEKGELRNAAGELITRIMVNMPPRHGKSALITTLFVVYYLARHPTRHVLSSSYADALAKKFGNDIRQYLERPELRQAYPDLALRADARAKNEWSTTAGGSYYGVGIGGSTTGKPANCVAGDTLVDTPAGPRRIDTIGVGDMVLSYNHALGRAEYRPVLATLRTPSREVIALRKDGADLLVCTADHPIFDGQTYRPAGDFTDDQSLFALRDTHQALPLLLHPRLLSGGVGAGDGAFLRAMWEGLRRADHGEEADPHPAVLLSGLPSREHAGDQAVRAVRPAAEEERQAVLLGRLFRRGQAATEASLRRVRQHVRSLASLCAGVLGSVQAGPALAAHAGAGQPQLAAWAGQPALLAGLPHAAPADPGAGRECLRAVRQRPAAVRASHRREQVQRRPAEPDHALPHLPHSDAQDGGLVPVAGACVREAGRAEVFDIQVAGNANFFANGILVHNCLLIDDPVKNRTEAESATYRDRVWDMYTGSLANRKEPANDDGSVPIEIVVMTRWHPDDLGGRLQASPEWSNGLWHHLKQPALTELDDGTLRALWPERFPVSELLLHKARSGRDFEALYQQNPVVQGGNLIKSDWWQRYDPNEYADHAYQSLIIAADTAFKKTEQADFSVFLIAALTAAGDIHLLDLLRLKLEFPELKRRAISLNALWRGRGLRGLYIEDKASGQSLIQELKAQSGISVIAHKVVNDKVARVNAVLPLIEGGRVHLPTFAPWLEAFEEECSQFPASAHDDQVDALSLALDVLSRQTVMPGAMAFDPTRSLNSQGWAVAQAMQQPLHKDPFQWGSLNSSPTLPKALGDF